MKSQRKSLGKILDIYQEYKPKNSIPKRLFSLNFQPLKTQIKSFSQKLLLNLLQNA